MYDCAPLRPHPDSHLRQVRQDGIRFTSILRLGHPACASGTDGTVSLPFGKDANILVYLFNSIYALTLGKKCVAAFFSAITLVQFITGMYGIVIVANTSG